MKRTIYGILLVMLLISMSGCGGSRDVKLSASGYYVYPVTRENFNGTVEEVKEACRIPQSTLDIMSDEALAQAVADHPFVMDVFLSSHIPPDLSFMGKNIDAYRELLTREKGREALLEKVYEYDQKEGVDAEIVTEALKVLLLYNAAWEGEFTEEEKAFLEVYHIVK